MTRWYCMFSGCRWEGERGWQLVAKSEANLRYYAGDDVKEEGRRRHKAVLAQCVQHGLARDPEIILVEHGSLMLAGLAVD